MANVAVQKSEMEAPAPTQGRALEPFRLFRDLFRADPFRELIRWDPFAEMVPNLGREMGFAPAFEVKEAKDGFVFKADLPGVKETDLDVKLSQNRLSISGKRESEKSEKSDTFYTYERSYGSFTRSFTLPEGTDGDRIKAELKEGVLTVEVPKRPEMQPKKISVKAT